MKRLYLLGLLICCAVMTLHAATYCAETITSTNGKHTAKITCSSLGDNQYQFIFVSTDAFSSYNVGGSNFYMNVNGVGGYHVSEHLTQTGNTLTATIESNVVPTIYVGVFYLNYSDGEAQFNIPTDADFSQTCGTLEGGGTEPSFDPNANLALGKPVVVGFGADASNITDGNLATRWSGNGAPKDYSQDWVYIDLGDTYRLNEVDIFFEDAYSKHFVIQGANELPADVSNDLFWKPLYSFSGEPLHEGTEAGKNAYMVSGIARYVRIRSYANSLENNYGMSIWEVRVYGTEKATVGKSEPQITTAEVVSFNAKDNSLTLRLIASSTIDGKTVYTHDFRIEDSDHGFAQRLITDDNNLLTLRGLKACEAYQFSIVAIDELYNSSVASSLSYALESANWVYGKTCKANYSQGDYKPELAVDGDLNTRWSGYREGGSDACWWQVDMGEIHDVKDIRILFENNWIDDYTISVSNDDNNWSPIVICNESPITDDFVRHSVSAIARYVRIEVFGGRRNLSFYDFSVSGSCVIDDKPRMVLAQVVEGSITLTSAQIQVSAVDAQTAFKDMKYHIVVTKGSDVSTMENVSAPDGRINIDGLDELTEYTLQIWAIDEDKKWSDNSLLLTFSTEGKLVDLYLSGTMNGWDAADSNYRFRKTKVSGVYALTTRLAAGSCIYKLTNGSFGDGNCTKDDHHLVLSEPTDVTFYARSVTNFASSADSIFLIGTALKDQEWTVPTHAQYCAWNGTQAVWSGEVNPSGEYKIIKIAYFTDETPFAYWNDLWEENQTLSGISTTQAVFTFDLPTLTWSWRELHDGQCDFMGGSGDGQIGNGSQQFTTGYNLTLWLNATRDAVVLTAEFLDTDKTATIAYMQNYPQRNEAIEINEVQLDRVADTQIFQKEIPLTSFTNRADGVIRFGVKFAFDGGLRVTTPEFFYLDGSGCAERIFTIYHHDDMPAKPEDGAVTTFAGGRILQPIKYKRKFKPGVWETLCVPFEVDSITVTDNEGTYHLYAQYDQDNDPNTSSVSGHFWLREFRNSSVCAEDFQENWYDIQAANEQAALPKKNQPYIMRVPEGDYYADKYITFHGKGYQTIDANYSAPVLPAEGQFSYSGNNTMRPWHLLSAYVLDAKGEYFSSDQPVTLQPFECAVNATQQTIQRMPRLSISPRQVATAQQLPVTENVSGNIYTMMGVLVGHFQSIDQQEDILRNLPNGLYILQSGMETTKIFIR